ncbi:hypothetical protein KSP39_PZI009817 [Platanthera zijinensis]|uniref:Uncharacterized protein n=1 Tax=Platanthera zijinensis TaxID=2320716 RepID=A0AAP0BIU7_9ASPA
MESRVKERDEGDASSFLPVCRLVQTGLSSSVSVDLCLSPPIWSSRRGFLVKVTERIGWLSAEFDMTGVMQTRMEFIEWTGAWEIGMVCYSLSSFLLFILNLAHWLHMLLIEEAKVGDTISQSTKNVRNATSENDEHNT